MALRFTLLSILSAFLAIFLLGACVSCAPRGPVVNSPLEPWEEALVKEKASQGEGESREGAAVVHTAQRDGYGSEDSTDEHNIIATMLVDILSFPLRGAAWLAHTIL